MAENNLKKNKQGYGYQYTDLSAIHEYLEGKGWSYYQFIEDKNGIDYVFTVKINEKGEESKPLQGCRVIQASLSGKNNPAQEQGSGLTYARRYSLLLAYGLATTDDDAQCFTRPAQQPKQPDNSMQEAKDLAMSDMRTAISLAGLQDVWVNNAWLQKDPEFFALKELRKKELK